MASPLSDNPTRRDGLIAAVLALVVALGLHALVNPGQLGLVNDDATYAVSARALASGLGYMDTAQAEPSPASRYPILYPLLLAASTWGASGSAALLDRMLWVTPLFAGLFVGLSYWYFRRRLAWGRGPALLGAGAIALHPAMAWTGTLLLSDLPFAALSLGALLWLERLLRREGPPSLAAWAIGGLLIAAACLTRYAGVTLLVATGLALLQARHFRPLLAVAGGFAAGFGPWLLYRASLGGEEYHVQVAGTLERGLDFVVQGFGESSAFLLSVALPGLLAPAAFTLPGVGSFVAGVALSAVVLLGALNGWRRPGPGRTALAPLYLILTAALALVWSIGFLELGAALHTRLLLPVLPLAFAAFLDGLRVLLGQSPLWTALRSRLVATVAMAAVVATSGVLFAASHTAPERAVHLAKSERLQRGLFDAIRQQTPATARLLSLHPTTVHWFTDRHCYGMLYDAPTERLAHQILASRIDYVVGMPLLLPEPKPIPGAKLPPTPFRPVDHSVAILNELLTAYPDLLEPVYVGGKGSYALFRVRPEAVAR